MTSSRQRPGSPSGELGRPALVEQIRTLIQETGPITFARFMELALYAPDLGYYATLRTGARDESGALADFQTSPQVHPLFGRLVATELLEIWRALGRPEPFVIAEPGAGAGELAEQILAGFAEREPTISVVYHAVDGRAPPQETTEAPVWWSNLSELRRAGTRVHCLISNEFFDALPVHRLARIDGRLREVYVDWTEDGFAEKFGPLSDPALAGVLGERGDAEGWRGEVCGVLNDVLEQLAGLVDNGVILTIDYGYGVADGRLGGPPGETLVAYHRHNWNDDVYRRVGRQDLTSHLDFAALFRLGRHFGLEPAGALTQRDFLLSRGLADETERWAVLQTTPGRQWQTRFASADLIRPDGLGRLKVAAQRKGAVEYSLESRL